MKKLEKTILSGKADSSTWENYTSQLQKTNLNKAKLITLSRNENKDLEKFQEYYNLLSNESDKEWIARFIVFKGLIGEFTPVDIEIYYNGLGDLNKSKDH